MRKHIAIIAIAAIVSFGCSHKLNVWENTTDPNPLKRFIPVELWTGGQWNGTKEIRMNNIDKTFGKREQKKIQGTFYWNHPETGNRILVYERTNKTKKGLKYQLFAVNNDKSGIGKVFDERPGKQKRYFQGEVLFPLGYWRQGETRVYKYYEYINGGSFARNARITIKKISFKYKKIPFSLEYDWLLTDNKGNVIFYENFIYSPGKSMVRFKNLLKR